jgi:hypothetical protein
MVSILIEPQDWKIFSVGGKDDGGTEREEEEFLD